MSAVLSNARSSDSTCVPKIRFSCKPAFTRGGSDGRVARTYVMKQCKQTLVGLMDSGKVNGAPYRFIKFELTPGVKMHAVRI